MYKPKCHDGPPTTIFPELTVITLPSKHIDWLLSLDTIFSANLGVKTEFS
jgi:hypothetical protein